MTKNKLVAWGSNIMVRMETGNSVIERVNPTATDGLEPEGVVVSTGKGVPEAEVLIDRKVRFNFGLVSEMFGDANKDEYVFALMPHPAIVGVYIEDEPELVS